MCVRIYFYNCRVSRQQAQWVACLPQTDDDKSSTVVVKSTRLDSTRLLFPKRNSRRRTTNLQLFFLFFFFLSFKSKNVKFYFSDFNWKEINPSSRSLSLSL